MNKEDEETQRWLNEGSYGGGYPVSYQKSPRTTDRIKQEHAQLVEALEQIAAEKKTSGPGYAYVVRSRIECAKIANAILEKVK